MARRESDREDLFAEATALVRRIELTIADRGPTIVAGWRMDGSCSIYVGEDPVYHFNSDGDLRRAYRYGKMIKAEDGRLIQLERVRQDGEVQLQRTELNNPAVDEILDEVQQVIDNLTRSLQQRTARVSRVSPADLDALGLLQSWLATLRRPVAIAERPNVR